jgi:cytochrome c peroxidase
MHQGQFATLREVIIYYSTLQGAVPSDHHAEQIVRPLRLAESEIDDLVSFLKTLDGEPPDNELLKELPRVAQTP